MFSNNFTVDYYYENGLIHSYSIPISQSIPYQRQIRSFSEFYIEPYFLSEYYIEPYSEVSHSEYVNQSIYNGVSNEILEKIKKSACFFDKKKHDKNTICIICQEKVHKKSKLISCSGCKQLFCTGSDGNCKGIIFHAKINKYCPCCRKNIEDWDFTINNQTITDTK